MTSTPAMDTSLRKKQDLGGPVERRQPNPLRKGTRGGYAKGPGGCCQAEDRAPDGVTDGVLDAAHCRSR